MAGRFETTVVIDRSIEDVFAFLADGENDPKFSPRVLQIAKTTDGAPVSAPSTPARSRTPASRPSASSNSPSSSRSLGFAGRSSPRTSSRLPTGGYDLAREGTGTRVTIYNVLEGHGLGKLIAPLALRSARKGADDFGKAIKSAVEAS